MTTVYEVWANLKKRPYLVFVKAFPEPQWLFAEELKNKLIKQKHRAEVRTARRWNA